MSANTERLLTTPPNPNIAFPLIRAIQTIRANPEEWQASKEKGDQEFITQMFIDLAQFSDHPDFYRLNILGKKVLVVHSLNGLQALADNPDIDKAPASLIAVAVSRDPQANDWVLGKTDRHGGSYAAYRDQVVPYFDAKKRVLKETIRTLFPEYFNQSEAHEFSVRKMQYFSAAFILSDFFPHHNWNKAEVEEFIDMFEKTVALVGPTVQNATLMGTNINKLINNEKIVAAFDNHNPYFSRLFEEDQAGPEPRGLMSALYSVEGNWSKTLANTITTVIASYETIATSMSELIYQAAKNPAIWEALRQASGQRGGEAKNLFINAIYEAVRIITPQGMSARKAERPTTLLGTKVAPNELIIALLTAPMKDPQLFENPETMRLNLTEEQIAAARFAWWPNPTAEGVIDRRCKGFDYSIAALMELFTEFVTYFEAPQMVHDDKIGTYGPHSRKHFKAQLIPRS